MRKVVFVLLLVLFFSCKKESDQKFDWQLVNNNGTNLNIIYNKTEQELINCTSCGNFNGNGWNLKFCNYYKVSEPIYCWYSDSRGTYYGSMPEKLAHCFVPDARQIMCTSCDYWYSRIKNIYKKNGYYTIGSITKKCYISKDTISLFSDITKQIIIRNTLDSLILLERSFDGKKYY
jgi:hypothetical protein